MGLFDKKFCDICGDKIGLLGNRKLDDGNMCKNCAGLLSPFMTDRRRTSIADIKEHLEYREANKELVKNFNLTSALGGNTKVLLDEDARRFIITSARKWQDVNPDVMEYSQVAGCRTEIKESRTEIKWKNGEGKEFSYNPPRYDVDYDFYATVSVNSPWFSEINFKINSNRIKERNSVEYQETEKQAKEIKEALTQVRQEIRDDIAMANAPKVAQICPLCGATTMPDASGCCEYCGGAMN